MGSRTSKYKYKCPKCQTYFVKEIVIKPMYEGDEYPPPKLLDLCDKSKGGCGRLVNLEIQP